MRPWKLKGFITSVGSTQASLTQLLTFSSSRFPVSVGHRKVMENLAFALILIYSFAYSAPNYLGNSQEGYAISAEKAAELAKPHLYEAYKLRVTNVADSEEEFWTRGYPIHVTLKNDYYYGYAVFCLGERRTA